MLEIPSPSVPVSVAPHPAAAAPEPSPFWDEEEHFSDTVEVAHLTIFVRALSYDTVTWVHERGPCIEAATEGRVTNDVLVILLHPARLMDASDETKAKARALPDTDFLVFRRFWAEMSDRVLIEGIVKWTSSRGAIRPCDDKAKLMLCASARDKAMCAILKLSGLMA